MLFIQNVKDFAFNTVEYSPGKAFFSRWATDQKPYIYLYVSLADSIKKPMGLNYSYVFCGTDETNGNNEESKFKAKGYHTFCYKTYANSYALLNKKMFSYSNEAITFIIFHELIHNYLEQKKINIPYEYTEALCDVIGNYGALEYSLLTHSLDSISVKNQILINEEIYSCLNSAILKINQNPDNSSIINGECDDAIRMILLKSNSFQKDRFDYKVNNAYLLKNGYYCKYYFLLKKVLIKQKSIKGLLEVIKMMPEGSSECEKFLIKFT